MARYRRYLIKDENLLVVRGSIGPVIAGLHEYNSRHGIPLPPGELNSLVQELLAATALAAVSLAERESWGWSLTFDGMDLGFFVGIEPEGMICVNVLAARRRKASVMIQRQKAGLPLTQSHISPRSRSPREMVQQYFSEVDQTRARLDIKENGEGILVHALPGGNFDAVRISTETCFCLPRQRTGRRTSRGSGRGASVLRVPVLGKHDLQDVRQSSRGQTKRSVRQSTVCGSRVSKMRKKIQSGKTQHYHPLTSTCAPETSIVPRWCTVDGVPVLKAGQLLVATGPGFSFRGKSVWPERSGNASF